MVVTVGNTEHATQVLPGLLIEKHVVLHACVLRFVVRGESSGCRLFGTASIFEWLRNLLPHHSQGSSTERWSRNTLRVVTARVFYVLMLFFNVPLMC